MALAPEIGPQQHTIFEVLSTVHPKIMTALEDVLSGEVLDSILLRIKQVDETNDSDSAREILVEAVNGFVPNSPNVDLLL